MMLLSYFCVLNLSGVKWMGCYFLRALYFNCCYLSKLWPWNSRHTLKIYVGEFSIKHPLHFCYFLCDAICKGLVNEKFWLFQRTWRLLVLFYEAYFYKINFIEIMELSEVQTRQNGMSFCRKKLRYFLHDAKKTSS